MLGGFEFCRILPYSDSGSAGKIRDLSTRPRSHTSATCGFVAKNRVVLGGLQFFPALPELRLWIESPSDNDGIRDNIQLSRTYRNAHLNKTRGCPPFGRNPLVKRQPTVGFRFLFTQAYLKRRMPYNGSNDMPRVVDKPISQIK